MSAADASPDPSPYPYAGPEAIRATILAALHRVVDPEVAMTIVDVGLVYAVTVTRIGINETIGERVFYFPIKSQVKLPDLKQLF